MKGKYSGSLPLNARVTVDYEKKDVRFSYPNKKSESRAKTEAMISLISIFFLFEIFIAGTILLLYALTSAFLALGNTPVESTFGSISQGLMMMLYMIMITFTLPLSATLYIVSDEKRLSELYPKIQMLSYLCFRGARTQKKTFRKTINKLIEIPMFENVILNYKATGDFSKHLKRIEIKEHDFTQGTKRNDTLWNCKFLFRKNCKKGYLKVEFI